MTVAVLVGVGLVWLASMGWRYCRQDEGYQDIGAGGLLFLLTVGFFWRTLSGDVYQPADGGDLVSFLYPIYRFAAAQIQQGSLPLWNPHLYGGAPFISDIQAGFLYPPNLLLFLLHPNFDYTTMQWLAIGHLYWAGLGSYVLVRRLGFSRPAAFFAALAFQFSDPLLIHLGNLNLIAVLSWLPWVLAAYHTALTRRDLRWAGLAALLFVVGNYAGHAQSTFYVGLALGLYTLFWVAANGDWERRSDAKPVGERASNGRRRSLVSSAVLIFVVTGGLTFLFTAPIFLPSLRMAQFTQRSHFTYQEAVDFSLAPVQAIGLLTPGFFGRGPALHWSLWQRVELPYAGVVTLGLALVTVVSAGAYRRNRRLLVAWGGPALFGFVLALGIYAVVHGWLVQLLPGFAQFRAPARALVLWTLGLSVLAAAGLDTLCRAGPSPANEAKSDRPRQMKAQRTDNDGEDPTFVSPILSALLKYGALVLVGFFTPLMYLALLLTQSDPTAFLRASVAALAVTLAAGFWLATWALIGARQRGAIKAPLFAGLAIGLLFFDLSATGAYTDVGQRNPATGFEHPQIVAFLHKDPDRFRIDTRTDIEDLWQPDTAALVGLQDVWGVANPLVLEHWAQLWEATGGRQTRRYDLLNVKYVVVRDGTPLPEKFVLALDAPGPLALYRNTAFIPRAWLVHQVDPQPDWQAALAALQRPEFDPQTTVLLSDGETDVEDFAAEVTPAQGAESVAIDHYGSNELTLQVRASTPAVLVLSEVWYPGWRATVNGEAASVLRANAALRGVVVPAGESTVRLWFAPAGWRWGWVLFGLGILGLAAAWRFSFFPTRQRKTSAHQDA